MEEVVRVSKVNEAYIKVDCSPSVAYELSDYFSYDEPGARFMPQVRARLWDGKRRLFGLMSREMYSGLYLHLVQFCKERSYDIEKVPTEYGLPLDIHPVRIETLETFCKSLNLHYDGKPISIYDHQLQGVFYGLKHRGKLLLSPTGSGKSLIIYVILRYLKAYNQMKGIDKSQILIVPRTSLVEQMYSDFQEYSYANKWPVADMCARIYSGLPKDPPSPIVITTWQSIYQQPKPFFDKYYTVIGDEAHTWKAKCLTSIMSKCTEAPYRIGLTGTLDGTEVNKLVLEGLFGSVYQVATTKELQDKGILAPLKIKIAVLKYSDEERKAIAKSKEYSDEIAFLLAHEKRNRFVRNLAVAQKSNTLVLFNQIEKHGDILYRMIKEKVADGRNVYYIHGGVDVEEREAVRKIMAKETDAIVLASYGTYQLGINIPNLHNVVFGSPSKSRIRNLQSIGRGLRTTAGKAYCTLFDIADDLQWKNRVNHTLKHLLERIDIYNNEEFDYNLVEVPI